MKEQLKDYFKDKGCRAIYVKDNDGTDIVYIENADTDIQYNFIRFIDYADLDVVMLTSDVELSSELVDLLTSRGELLHE